MPLKQEKKKFALIAKRINKTNLSKNPDTLNTYKVDIVQAYNDFITFVTGKIINLKHTDDDLKESYLLTTEAIRKRFVKCLRRLEFQYDFLPNKPFQRVELTRLSPLKETSSGDQGDLSGSSEEELHSDEDEQNSQTGRDNQNDNDDQDNDGGRNSGNDPNLNDDENPIINMTTAQEFMSANIKIIPAFDGSFDALEGFIDALELLQMHVGNHTATAVSMIKTKLSKKARTCLLPTDNTIPLIIARLRASIVSESSEALIAKMQNVKQKEKKANKFSKEIEELADQLQSAYISEGNTPTLATKYTTQQTVSALMKNSSNERVKLVMQAGNFSSVNDAVAKFVSSNNESPPTHSIMFMSNKGSRRGYGRKNYGNNDYNQSRGNFRGNYRGNYGNNRGSGNRGYSNNHGRGRSRGNFRGNNRNDYYNAYNSGDGASVRYMNDQGNVPNPQMVSLGDRESQTRNQRN